MEKPTPTEKQVGDEIHAALCSNGVTSTVADWLVDLALRVRRMEKALEEGK